VRVAKDADCRQLTDSSSCKGNDVSGTAIAGEKGAGIEKRLLGLEPFA